MTLVVTGGGSGIGLATARLAVARGIRVAVLDLDVSAVDGEVDLAIPVDVTDADRVHSVVHSIGPVSGLATCAGIAPPAGLLDTGPSGLRGLFELNVFGTAYAMQACVPAMRAAGDGAMVTVSSVAAHRGGGLLGGTPYAASKAAVLGLTRAAARELAPFGIRVNSVAPGPVATPLLADDPRFAESTLLGRVAPAEEIAEAVLFLLGPGGRNITGETLNSNGGAYFA
ncbi:SDR family NAD(P)-dependent oxidoreductase [Amycolatopsis nigrescens]|uniref:SDR family NAD(P)-dependent oxidoreductase n=1 Tax=Amycolatopsis nigrescens TaxID=381445 RepID=UPI0003801E8F|nr:SDR family oxidoreductase [Amycolatopsis nigrescens]